MDLFRWKKKRISWLVKKGLDEYVEMNKPKIETNATIIIKHRQHEIKNGSEEKNWEHLVCCCFWSYWLYMIAPSIPSSLRFLYSVGALEGQGIQYVANRVLEYNTWCMESNTWLHGRMTNCEWTEFIDIIFLESSSVFNNMMIDFHLSTSLWPSNSPFTEIIPINAIEGEKHRFLKSTDQKYA